MDEAETLKRQRDALKHDFSLAKQQLLQLQREWKQRKDRVEQIRENSEAELEELHYLRRMKSDFEQDKRAITERCDSLEHALKVKEKMIDDNMDTIASLKRTVCDKACASLNLAIIFH
jgi:predicted  nucleic acid-binding Zn-ribbon protein